MRIRTGRRSWRIRRNRRRIRGLWSPVTRIAGDLAWLRVSSRIGGLRNGLLSRSERCGLGLRPGSRLGLGLRVSLGILLRIPPLLDVGVLSCRLDRSSRDSPGVTCLRIGRRRSSASGWVGALLAKWLRLAHARFPLALRATLGAANFVQPAKISSDWANLPLQAFPALHCGERTAPNLRLEPPPSNDQAKDTTSWRAPVIRYPIESNRLVLDRQAKVATTSRFTASDVAKTQRRLHRRSVLAQPTRLVRSNHDRCNSDTTVATQLEPLKLSCDLVVQLYFGRPNAENNHLSRSHLLKEAERLEVLANDRLKRSIAENY